MCVCFPSCFAKIRINWCGYGTTLLFVKTFIKAALLRGVAVMKRQRKSQPNGKSSSEGPALSREQAARAKKTRKSKQQEGSGEEVKIVLQYFFKQLIKCWQK